MGKNHRHSKKLKSEKNKVHIKSKTKFLPKGQNVTNTSFKIKAIVLQEQLRDKEATSYTNKKKANIDELVSKLKHYNATVKVEACQDLKDLITQDFTHKYMSSILQNTSALVQDIERKVRRAAIKLLHVILDKVSNKVLRPFFKYILLNLKCAMTNINKHIQEDSLLVLDQLLEHKSLLVAENFDSIFPNFLMLISKSKGQSSVERSLSLNLEGKVTSVKWRIKVLSRLYGILYAMMKSREKNNDPGNCNDAAVTVNAKGACFIPIYKDISVYENIDFTFTVVNKSENCTEFDARISNLIQLLHEIWMEVVPEKKKNHSEPTVLPSEESVAIFCCIVNILRLLQSGNEELFTENKSALFLDHLFNGFPYIHNRKKFTEITKEFPKSFVFNFDQNCFDENLIIIYIFITLRIKNVKNNINYKTVGPYLNNCLKSQHRLSSKSFSYLIKILKEVLLTQRNLCRRLGINTEELRRNIAIFYSSPKISETCKNDVLEILTDSRIGTLQFWTDNLPEFLCEKKVSAKLIEAVLDLCKKGQERVQSGVKKSLGRILRNLSELEITEAIDIERARMNMVGIFFYLPDLSKEDIGNIDDFIELNPNSSYSKYFRNVLELRICMSK